MINVNMMGYVSVRDRSGILLRNEADKAQSPTAESNGAGTPKKSQSQSQFTVCAENFDCE